MDEAEQFLDAMQRFIDAVDDYLARSGDRSAEKENVERLLDEATAARLKYVKRIAH